MMNSSRSLLPIFVFLVIVYVQQFPDTESTSPTSKVNRYCGRNLVNLLTMVCDGVYNYQMPVKNGIDGIQLPQLREKRSVVTIFQRSRYKRGVYDECCRKGCSIDEMAGYCGNS